MRSIIQSTEVYQLSIDITTSVHGHSLQLISFVPSATRIEGCFKRATALLQDILFCEVDEPRVRPMANKNFLGRPGKRV